MNDTRSYYFDVSQVDRQPDAGASPPEWKDDRTRFSAPFQIGWMHFDRAIDFARGDSALNTALQYSSLGSKASIYLYGSADRSAQGLVEAELEIVSDMVCRNYSSAEPLGPTIAMEPFLARSFVIGEDLSVAAVSILGRHFLKLCLTFQDNSKMRELMGETIRELARLVLRGRADA